MKKKKGFTLVELLGVIVILALIVVVAAPPIIEKLKKAEGEIDEASFALIESAVDLYIDDNSNKYPNINGNIYCITLQQLVNDGKLKPSVLNVQTGEEIDLNTLMEVKFINQNMNVSINNNCVEYIGPAVPELTTGMIPVVYDGTNWVKADINSEWYDYRSKEWANAVTVTSTNRSTYLSAAPGTVIPMSDINTMWVWIPRYKYAIPTNTGTLERSINIVFESKTIAKSTGNAIDTNYRTHPAFTFGTTEVSGMWVGKFETTGTIGSPTILPNTISLRDQTAKAMYDSSRAMQNNSTYGFSTDGNIHMAKDSEWGAVAYLSHSIYGINKEIYINPSSSRITGRGGNTVSQAGTTDISGSASSTLYSYDGKQCSTKIGDECAGTPQSIYGMASSTTGNIYGVYDMSGGAWEYTMGMYRPTDTTLVTDSSGFGATTSDGTLPTSEYWDRYTTTTDTTACSEGICYGRAFSETSGWYSDYAGFVNASSSWSFHGSAYSATTTAGAFSHSASGGSAGGGIAFRVIILGE